MLSIARIIDVSSHPQFVMGGTIVEMEVMRHANFVSPARIYVMESHTAQIQVTRHSVVWLSPPPTQGRRGLGARLGLVGGGALWLSNLLMISKVYGGNSNSCCFL